jgi:ribosomal protein S12 methylthiotransferase accessory factor
MPAALSAIAETIERRFFSSPNQIWIRNADFLSLRGAVFPAECLPYFLPPSPSLKTVNLSKISSWVLGYDWIQQKPCWIPAGMVFWSYRNLENAGIADVLFCPITTNGCASGPTFHQAANQAFLELIERDAFLIMWMRMLPPPRIEVPDLLCDDAMPSSLRKVLQDSLRYQLELHILQLPTEFPVHVFCSVLRDPSGAGPAVSVGAKASPDPYKAIEGAILESFAVFQFLRMRRLLGAASHKKAEDMRAYVSGLNRVGRMDLWGQPEMFHKIDWFLSGAELEFKPGKLKVYDYGDANALFGVLARLAQEKDFHLFSYTIPDQNLQGLGFWLVRIIIPELIPLYLQETEAPLHHPRLVSRAVELGLPSRSLQWNSSPHPFS